MSSYAPSRATITAYGARPPESAAPANGRSRRGRPPCLGALQGAPPPTRPCPIIGRLSDIARRCVGGRGKPSRFRAVAPPARGAS